MARHLLVNSASATYLIRVLKSYTERIDTLGTGLDIQLTSYNIDFPSAYLMYLVRGCRSLIFWKVFPNTLNFIEDMCLENTFANMCIKAYFTLYFFSNKQ